MNRLYKILGAAVLSTGLATYATNAQANWIWDQAKGLVSKAKEGASEVSKQKLENPEDLGMIGNFVENTVTGVVGGVTRGTLSGLKKVAYALNKESGVQEFKRKLYHTFSPTGRKEFRMERTEFENAVLGVEAELLLARLKTSTIGQEYAKPGADYATKVTAVLEELKKVEEEKNKEKNKEKTERSKERTSQPSAGDDLPQ